MSWEKGHLVEMKLVSKLGNDCKLRYGNRVAEIKTEEGNVYHFDHNLEQI